MKETWRNPKMKKAKRTSAVFSILDTTAVSVTSIPKIERQSKATTAILDLLHSVDKLPKGEARMLTLRNEHIAKRLAGSLHACIRQHEEGRYGLSIRGAIIYILRKEDC